MTPTGNGAVGLLVLSYQMFQPSPVFLDRFGPVNPGI